MPDEKFDIILSPTAGYVTEVLIEIAIDLGISKDDAINFAKNTFIGSGYLLESEVSDDVISLRKNVTSPGGTTEAALNILMNKERGLKVLLKKAVLNAIDRAKELRN